MSREFIINASCAAIDVTITRDEEGFWHPKVEGRNLKHYSPTKCLITASEFVISELNLWHRTVINHAVKNAETHPDYAIHRPTSLPSE